MNTVTKIQRVSEDELGLDQGGVLRVRIQQSPLLAVGAAVGAGALTWVLLHPGSKSASRRFENLNGSRVSKKLRTDFHAMVGAFALRYLKRKLLGKLHLS